MRPGARRVVGIIFMFLAAAAMIVTVLAVFRLWQLKEQTSRRIAENLELIESALTSTSNGLTIAESTIDSLSGSVDSLQTAADELSGSLSDTAPMLETMEDMVAIDLPATISATQTSLTSAAGSAVLIDNMLSALANVPLLNLGRYTPDPPLSVSLAEASGSLDTLKPSLETVAGSLSDAQDHLENIETQVETIGSGIDTISANLDDARTVIDSYQETVGELHAQVETYRRNLPGAMDEIAWWITFVLIWMFITQAAVFIWAWGAFRTVPPV